MSETKIYSGTSQVRIMAIKNLLESEGIVYQEINKMDSAYAGLDLGAIELYVSDADAEKTLQLMKTIKK